MNQEYERNYSHSHCWDQVNNEDSDIEPNVTPACGQPLEKHTQCCLCNMLPPTVDKCSALCQKYPKQPDVISEDNKFICPVHDKGEEKCEHRSWETEIKDNTMLFKKCNGCGVTSIKPTPDTSLEDWESGFDEMINTGDIPFNLQEARKWLEQNSDKHLFENDCYGEPMFDLSVEKVKSFIRKTLAQERDEHNALFVQRVRDWDKQVRQEKRDRIKKVIEGMKWKRDESGLQHMYNIGVQVRNSAIEEVLSAISREE